LRQEIDNYTTMMYRPPEMVDLYQDYEISEKADIWMLGCILYTLMFFTHPFQDESTLAITNANYSFPSSPRFSAPLQDLVRWLLSKNPKDRPSANQVLEAVQCVRNGAPLSAQKSAVDQWDTSRNPFSGGKETPRKDHRSSALTPSTDWASPTVEKSSKSSHRKSSKHRQTKLEDNDINAGVHSKSAWIQPCWPQDVLPQPDASWATFETQDCSGWAKSEPQRMVPKTAEPFPVGLGLLPPKERQTVSRRASKNLTTTHPDAGDMHPAAGGPNDANNWDPFGHNHVARTSTRTKTWHPSTSGIKNPRVPSKEVPLDPWTCENQPANWQAEYFEPRSDNAPRRSGRRHTCAWESQPLTSYAPAGGFASTPCAVPASGWQYNM